jgi:AmmeMemoRadiSam system protein B/AmmeMemoRadiSam system protein A
MDAVRPAVLAGSWYPGDPDRLRDEVDRYLALAEPDRAPAGTPTIALAPHAGYQYSGAVAGKLFGVLAGRRFDAVFVLAPNHRAPVDRPVLSSMTAFATPLGEVPVATAIVAALEATGEFAVNDRAHGFEHAVEIQLPFIQRALPPGTPVVPILVPHLAADQLGRAAAHLDRWRDGRHLFLVSSDLTHYGAEYGYVPFTDDVPARLEKLDSGALLRFLAHDAAGLLTYGDETGITMCGLPAAALALTGAPPANHQSALLDYARSADREGDFTMSVSYAAALICDPAPAASEPGLTASERSFLVDLARRAVTAAVRGATPPDPGPLIDAAGLTPAPRLAEPRGAFVTLTRHGALRGCIGYIEGIKPLVEAVVDNGAAAATADPRFPAVSADELPEIEVEVSALTPLRNVDGPDAIVIGRHGIVLEQAGHRAVFLPQVAPEQGWDLPTTLTQLALKAGLAADAWRRDCRFQVFEAEICED